MNDDQHSWTYELYDASRPAKKTRRQTVLLKKTDLYTNIAQNWFQTEQLTQYYNTNFSPLTERKWKKLKRLVNFS